MQDSGAFVTGIDLEQEAIDYARRNYPGPEYILADVAKYHGRYDWVVSFETIEHLADPLPALKRFRESKRLIVSTPNEVHYPFDPKNYEGDRFPHIRHYTPDDLEFMLNNCGWRVVSKHRQKFKESRVTDGVDGKFMVFVCQ